jgi:hypothetical protein
MWKVFALLGLISCGSDGAEYACRPRVIALAECQANEWKKNPSTLSLQFQEQYCKNLYPFEMCYAY